MSQRQSEYVETWVDIPGYEGLYKVSNHGQVMSLSKPLKPYNKIMKPYITWDGYKMLNLWKNSKSKSAKIHRLVAQTFVENPKNKPCVNHIDGNKLNNHYKNLEWCTRSENDLHAYKLGLRTSPLKGVHKCGEMHNMARLTADDVLFIRGNYHCDGKKSNAKELSDMFSVSNSAIQSIVHRHTWRHI